MGGISRASLCIRAITDLKYLKGKNYSPVMVALPNEYNKKKSMPADFTEDQIPASCITVNLLYLYSYDIYM